MTPTQEYEEHRRFLVELNTKYLSTMISGGVTFGASLFGVSQLLQLIKINSNPATLIFLILGISFFIIALTGFFTVYTRLIEERLKNEEAWSKHLYSLLSSTQSESIIQIKPIRISETFTFIFIISQGFILFSRVSQFMYVYPYLVLLWILLYLLSAYIVCYKTELVISKIPTE